MDIITCLLEERNDMVVCGTTLGEILSTSGKACLWGERKENRVDTIVVHHISAIVVTPDDPYSRERILKIFCEYGVSSHYLVERSGAVLRLAPEEMKAWHAGGSIMPHPDNRSGVNEFSLGIELVATPDSGFTGGQYDALAALCLDIEKRYGRAFTYVGHEDIAGERAVALGLRKDVKVDPGRLFDWKGFRERLDQGRGAVS
jgi:N-acetyl-anhydromuramyl-L-alanine amidase AmpD